MRRTLSSFALSMFCVAINASAQTPPVQLWRPSSPICTLYYSAQTLYNPDRGALWLFDTSGKVWEWDGEVWTLILEDRFWPNSSHTLVYDTRRKCLVGPGYGSAYYGVPDPYAQWIEFDGTVWSDLRAPLGPVPRTGAAVGYDPIADETIMSGGIYRFRDSPSGYNYLNDTWVYNGTDWAWASSGSLPHRSNSVMGFDLHRGVMVMAGGYLESWSLQEVWERVGGGTWQLAGTQVPDRLQWLVYDPRRKMMMASASDSTFRSLVEWWWNGRVWEQGRTLDPFPTAGYFADRGYDVGRNAYLLRVAVTRNARNESELEPAVFEYRQGAWVDLSQRQPMGRVGAAMVWDQSNEQALLFGGFTGVYSSANSGYAIFTPEPSTWTYASGIWTEHVTPGPSQRMTFAMCYDSQRQRSVVFGGRQPPANTVYYNDTWEWDGASWTQRQVQGPSARARMAMAYDRRRGVSVLYGGYMLPPRVLFDTWEWNGTTWTQRQMPGPPARYRHSMTYDESRGVVVLFGGLSTGDVPLGETWEYDGVAWTLRSSSGPEPRHSAQLEYDSIRNVCVLWGGANATTALSDTWEWDGTTWTARTDLQTLDPKNSMASAFDRGRGEMIGFGGMSSVGGIGALRKETWTLGSPCPAPVIQTQPADTNAAYFGSATFSVAIEDDGSSHRYQWRRGEPPVFIDGATSPTLTIEHATIADVGPYDCIVTTDGICFRERVVSRKATLSICLGDFDGDGQILVADYAAFIDAYEAGDAPADFNGDGFIDFFDHDAFVEAYETGC